MTLKRLQFSQTCRHISPYLMGLWGQWKRLSSVRPGARVVWAFFFFFFNSHVVDLQCCASLLAVAFLSIQILRAPGVRAGC